MPELPEVETVKRGLASLFPGTSTITRVEVIEARLRQPIKQSEVDLLQGARVLAFHRRAKYLLWETDDMMIVSHLGMTGSWRIEAGSPLLHDHVRVHFRDDKRILVYNDPRRFGLLRVVDKREWPAHPFFAHLGPEPFDKRGFHADYLHERARGRKVPVKNFLMDQEVVVGIGNIYASEVLFLAGVRPSRRTERVSRQEWARIVQHSRRVLRAAIASGGTTFRDFRQTGGGEGHFYQRLRVYDRQGLSCRRCCGDIRKSTLGGRSSFWCPTCQK